LVGVVKPYSGQVMSPFSIADFGGATDVATDVPDVDRYSLIFYDTTDRHQTDIITTGVDIPFLNK